MMFEGHEHVCTCGAHWPITDADALHRQSSVPILVANAGAAAPQLVYQRLDWTNAGAAVAQVYTIRLPTT